MEIAIPSMDYIRNQEIFDMRRILSIIADKRIFVAGLTYRSIGSNMRDCCPNSILYVRGCCDHIYQVGSFALPMGKQNQSSVGYKQAYLWEVFLVLCFTSCSRLMFQKSKVLRSPCLRIIRQSLLLLIRTLKIITYCKMRSRRQPCGCGIGKLNWMSQNQSKLPTRYVSDRHILRLSTLMVNRC